VQVVPGVAKPLRPCGVAYEAADIEPGVGETVRETAADESGGARDQRPHPVSARSPEVVALASRGGGSSRPASERRNPIVIRRWIRTWVCE
jgi:hypothetical protein